MSKKNIECEYCHTLISEDDVKCPQCGANCSNVIKKYREEQEKKEKEEKDEALKTLNTFVQGNRKIGSIFIIFFFIIFITIFGTVFFQIFRNFNNRSNINNNNTIIEKNDNKIQEPVVEDEKVVVKYNEMASTKKMNVILDGYELFEYHSDHFEQHNTPKGYQKIAFHFSVENLDDYSLSGYSLIQLTADDTNVEKCSIELSAGFEEVVKGKAKYESVVDSFIGSGKTLKGYAGFLVPTDKKELKFYIGEDITITMDNPAYKE